MSHASKVIQAAAGSGGGLAGGEYIAIAHPNSPYFTLLDHTLAPMEATLRSVTET